MDYKILPVGDSALTIIFGNSIDPEISRKQYRPGDQQDRAGRQKISH